MREGLIANKSLQILDLENKVKGNSGTVKSVLVQYIVCDKCNVQTTDNLLQSINQAGAEILSQVLNQSASITSINMSRNPLGDPGEVPG